MRGGGRDCKEARRGRAGRGVRDCLVEARGGRHGGAGRGVVRGGDTGRDDGGRVGRERRGGPCADRGRAALLARLRRSAAAPRPHAAACVSAAPRRSQRRTPLHIARSKEAVEALVAAKADVHAKDAVGGKRSGALGAGLCVSTVRRALGRGQQGLSVFRGVGWWGGVVRACGRGCEGAEGGQDARWRAWVVAARRCGSPCESALASS